MKSLLPFVLLIFIIASCSSSEEKKKPNIVYIFTDDLGYGDLGCFGATDIKTPNIDRLANEGMKFTEFYSASSICSPSRMALMTGRLPVRQGIHQAFFPSSYDGMPNDEITIAEMLKKAGYATGIVGKWHLGHMPEYLPLQQGFDSYYGIPYSNDMRSPVYMRNNKVDSTKIDQSLMIKTYVRESLDFIERSKDQPFYLYLAHNMPHVPIYASDDFLGTSERGLYGDVIQEIDWSVGQILESLELNGLLENTIVVFSSDNGPWLAMEDHGGSAGPLREGKFYPFEGGFRVPTLAMWKGNIEAGQVYDDLALQTDWFPTFCDVAGVSLPVDVELDGESLAGVLLNGEKRKGDEVYYFDARGGLSAYRKGDVKVKMPFKGFKSTIWNKGVAPHDTLVFNLKDDPGEHFNILKNIENPDTYFANREQALQRMGSLPEAMFIRTLEDNSHYEYLSEKHGGAKYWEMWEE